MSRDGEAPVDRQSALANRQVQIDVATFIQWIDARASGRTALADFYRRRFRPELRPAFAAWIATRPFANPAAPPTPLAMPRYRLTAAGEADRLEARAALFEPGEGRERARGQLHARRRAQREGEVVPEPDQRAGGEQPGRPRR